MSKYLVIANWKMNPSTFQEAEVLFRNILKAVRGLKDIEVVFCPPFVWLPRLAVDFFSVRPKSQLKLGAQDCHWEKAGAFTGEVSAPMLKDLGCQYVILGHSERRQYFGETDQIINEKIKIALKTRLKPILCIGEKETEREELSVVLENQLISCLLGVSQGQLERLVIAYEPVWAIGTGNACGVNDAMQAAILIRKILARLYGRFLSQRIKILYGGSVNSQNSKDYVSRVAMDGLLVGGASLNAGEFIKIIKSLVE